MKKVCFFVVLVLLVVNPIFSKDLEKSQVSEKSLKEILNKEFYENSSISDEGDLAIKNDGINYFIGVDKERFIIEFTTNWKKADSISDARLFKILNSWNSDKIFTTAYAYKSSIRMNYYLCFDGGVNSENFNATINWLFKLADIFRDYLHEEDAI